MSPLTFTLRSLRFYWRTHLGVLLGGALAAAVLTGALLIGDSVRYSLHHFALLRLGRISHAIQTGNRFFSERLADRLVLGDAVAPVLCLQGSAMRRGPASGDFLQIHRVQVIGMDSRFWGLSAARSLNLPDGEVAVNQRVARELGLAVGDELSLRVARPGLLPRDAPLSSRKDKLSSFVTLKVNAVIPDSSLGRFSLEANQASPRNVFVRLAWLQDQTDLKGKVNRLLIGAGEPPRTTEELQAALAKCWDLRLTGTTLVGFENQDVVQLESDRVFLDPTVARAALAVPGTPPPVGVLSYLVNSLSAGSGAGRRRTPYSFMNACSPSPDAGLSPVPADMKDDEILINRWLADQLAATTGTAVTVAYYELLPSGDFVEKQRPFTVRSIVEMNRLAGEKEFMPQFPGLSDVDSCKDWDVGMPMEEEALKDKPNEEYWNQYRATPKAFITLRTGQAMWGNRFGDLTAIRYPIDRVPDLTALTRAINPADLGLVFLPVSEQALTAVDNATDFGGLFLGMSFFLIASALILTTLLFVFGVEQRSAETGTLLALGYTPRRLRALLVAEGAVIALAGAVIGALAGTLYARLMLRALVSLWPDAIANSAVQYHATPGSLVVGGCAGFAAAILAIALALRRQLARPVSELLAADLTQSAAGRLTGPRGRGLLYLSIAAAVAAAGTVGAAVRVEFEDPAGPFFTAGVLLLLGGLGIGRHVLARLTTPSSAPAAAAPGPAAALGRLGLRNTARRLKRSMTVAALLASATFLVLAVSTMKTDVRAHADKPWSGTGGFDFFLETTLPIPEKPETPTGRKRLNLAGDERLRDVDIVSVKLREGDDASCFNLNRAQVPRLLGVNPADFFLRRAFMAEGSRGEPWTLLDQPLPDGAIPALAGDANTALWGLKKSASSKDNAIAYRDDRGNPFQVRIVGSLPARLSVFQGTVLVSNQAFTERFPSEDGFRIWLVRAPAGRRDEVRQVLAGKLDRFGPDISASADRLAQFYSVESAYLAMFLALGGLGLLLGSLGLGIVVLRNTQERRSELAVLRAIGYSRRDVVWLILSEHLVLLAVGLLIGAVAALCAMIPALRSPGVEVPVPTLAATIAGVCVSGVLWTWLATLWATRGPLLNALRNE